MELLIIIPFLFLYYFLKLLWYIFSNKVDKAKDAVEDLTKNRWWLLFSFATVIAVITFFCWPKEQKPTVLGVELGNSLDYAEFVLNKEYGDNIIKDGQHIIIKDTYADGFIFDMVEFQSDLDYPLPSVSTIRMSRYFADKTEADSFYKNCILRHEEKNPKEKPKTIKETHNGKESTISTYESKRHITGFALFYEPREDRKDWCVSVCYINTEDI
jgi:hypothetical protein